MSSKTNISPYSQLPQILYLFMQITIMSVFIFFFFITYITFEPEIFLQRVTIFERGSIYLTLAGILSLFIFFLFIGSDAKIAAIPTKKNNRFKFGTLPYILFIFFLLITTVSVYFELKSNYLQFLTFIAAIYAQLFLIKTYAFLTHRQSWNHPTTAGSIFQSVLALGSIFTIWVYQDENLINIFSWLLLFVLVLQGLTIWSRFKFLSITSQQTRKAAEMMLGSHLTLFGIRFIFGIVMPLIYLAWYLLINKLPYNPLILMIIVGELSERILFFITSGYDIEINEIQMNKNETKND